MGLSKRGKCIYARKGLLEEREGREGDTERQRAYKKDDSVFVDAITHTYRFKCVIVDRPTVSKHRVFIWYFVCVFYDNNLMVFIPSMERS